MKSLLTTMILSLAATSAMACPGSNLMTFKFKGKEAFVLNMQTGQIARVETNSNVALIALNLQGVSICTENPRARSRCSLMFPKLNITGQAGKVDLMGKAVNLEVTLSDGLSSRTISVAKFPGLARSARGCGPVVE